MSDGTRRRSPGLREVLLIAIVVVGAVLAIEAVSAAVPSVDEAFGGFPITAAVLAVGTIAVLALVLFRRPTRPRG
jgi:hypothetical protein